MVPAAHIPQGGGLLPAPLRGVPAAPGELAARRRVDGAGDLALQTDTGRLPLDLDLRVRNGDGGQQRLGIGVEGVAVQLSGAGDLHDVAQVHHPYAVGDVLDHGQVVGDKQIGQAHILL